MAFNFHGNLLARIIGHGDALLLDYHVRISLVTSIPQERLRSNYTFDSVFNSTKNL